MSMLRKSVMAMGLLGVALSLSACGSPVASTGKNSDTLNVVFLPSDSAKEEDAARKALTQEIHKATGKKVNVETTTDYNVAIQAIATGKAQIGLMGPDGYVQAHKQSKTVVPMVTYSGKSGTLKDAYYHSYIMVPKGQATKYKVNGKYSLKNIKGKRMSFVSNTSTSGFAIPAGAIKKAFNLKSTDDLSSGGKFFSKVLYGQSHQGSAVNLLKGDADVAAFDDMDLTQYGKFQNDATKAGAIFKINKDAPAPFTAVRGKESIAIAAYAVQNEPLVANTKTISKSDIEKIQKQLTSSSVTNNKLFFAPANAKVRGLFTKDGKTQFIKITDAWYKLTHDILGE
ncbi:MAG: Phosphate-import protein PhnD [Lentilactobacillus parabuchneri]|jgi:phosphonate transport system substrate-binding protein|uniref:phosphate/phosphite/phosphonate ABC transporter substrate-binding protein n=1 Tax=Lentilactobacillus parabuchneri TaxID=152331 RepID=UPI003A5BCB1A